MSKISLKVKGRSQTKSQKMQRNRQTNSRKNSIHKIFDHSSKGVGKYASRSKANLTAKQAYKLEKRALNVERAGLQTKPELIRAAGQAFATNVSPAMSSYGATAGTAKIIEATNKKDVAINSLINGGVDQAGTSNDEEMQDTLPGGAGIR